MAITDIGIASPQETEQKEELESILASINKANKELVQKAEEERIRKEQEEEELRIQEQKEKEAKANKERFLAEQERKRIRDEERIREELELEKIKRRNPFYSAIKKLEGSSAEKGESYAVYFLRSAIFHTGDLWRKIREHFEEKKYKKDCLASQKILRNSGLEVPAPKEYDPEEYFNDRMEQKEKEKEEKKKKAEELAKKKAEKKEELRLQKETEKAEKEEKRREAEERKKEEDRRKAALKEEEDRKKAEAKEEKKRIEEEKKKAKTVKTPVPDKPPVAPAVSSKKEAPPSEPEMSDEEYNKHLPDDVQDLKKLVVKEHIVPDFLITERAVDHIQKMRDVIAVIITSYDMNHLYIFNEPSTFVELAGKLNQTMNYSYIYIITTTAPVYFGANTCYHDLTELFNEIRKVILRYGYAQRTALSKIEGINMFKKIHLDA